MEHNVVPNASSSSEDLLAMQQDMQQRSDGLSVQVPMNRWPSIEAISVNVPEQAEDQQQRRQELREAGAAYLDKAISQASKGADPFQQQKPRRQRQERVDPEFMAFGKLLRDNLVYVYVAGFIVCQASSYVLISLSFKYMQTPAVLTFLHMLAAAAAVALACKIEMVEALQQLSLSTLKGGSVRIVLFSSQMLCMFSALHHNSVHVVLVWTTAGGAAIEAAVTALLGPGPGHPAAPIPREAALMLLVGFSAGVLELVFDKEKVAVGLLMLFLWAVSKATECVWKQMRLDPTLGGRLSESWLTSHARAVADEEAQLGGSSIALMQNLIPAVAVLLLGFICREGEELVNHEPSVPGVKVMLLACGAYALATVCQLLLDESLTQPSFKLALRGASLLGATVLYAMEEYKTVSVLAVALTLLSITSSLLATWRQKQAYSI